MTSTFSQMMNRFAMTSLALGLAAGLLASCGSVKTTMKKVSLPMQNLTKLNKNDWKMFKLRDLSAETPPIVQVRPSDLKKMKTGEENILAWNRSKRAVRSFASSPEGAFFMPEDFDPASLPSGDFETSYGILPSLTPGRAPTMEIPGELGTLPTAVPPGPPTASSEVPKDQ